MPRERQRLAALKRMRRVQKLKRDLAAAALHIAQRAVNEANQERVAATTALDQLHVQYPTQVRAIRQARELELLGAGQDLALDSVLQATRRTEEARRRSDGKRGAVSQAERALARTDLLVDRTRRALAKSIDRAEQAALDDLAPLRKKATR